MIEGVGIPKPATLYDVARAAGVSHQTVSRHLRGSSRVSPETRIAVDAAVKELGYRVNRTARALASVAPQRIVALVFDLQETGPSQIVLGAAHAAREYGYLFDIVPLADEREATIELALQALDPHGLAGVFVLGPTASIKSVLERTGMRLPIFLSDEAPDAEDGPPASLNGRGTVLAVEHLIELGHQRIVHVGGPRGWRASENRERANDVTTRAAGLTTAVVARGDWTPRSGFEAADEVIDSGATAVTVANDQMALGLLAGLAKRGIIAPRDISVVGFDDVPEAAYLLPALTTVRLDYTDQGVRRIRELLARLAGAEEPDAPNSGTIELIIRDSTRRI